MQTANIMVALGGDRGNTVPRYGVTPAEVAVLAAIHGDDAVTDITLRDDEAEETGGALLQSLMRRYGRAVDGENTPIVRKVFPTNMTPLPDNFDQIGLHENAFSPAALEAMAAKKPARKPKAKPAAPAAEDAMG